MKWLPIRHDSRISGALTCRSCSFWGKADPYLHVSIAEYLKSQAKNAAIHALTAGHWPQIDEAADTARIMLASQWP